MKIYITTDRLEEPYGIKKGSLVWAEKADPRTPFAYVAKFSGGGAHVRHDEAVVVPAPTDMEICEAMRTYGGGFVKALEKAYAQADSNNRARIRNAWPEYWEEYRELAEFQVVKRMAALNHQ